MSLVSCQNTFLYVLSYKMVHFHPTSSVPHQVHWVMDFSSAQIYNKGIRSTLSDLFWPLDFLESKMNVAFLLKILGGVAIWKPSFFFVFYFYFYFCILGLHPQHMEVHRLESNRSCICQPPSQPWQHRILDLLSRAGDGTRNLMVPNRIPSSAPRQELQGFILYHHGYFLLYLCVRADWWGCYMNIPPSCFLCFIGVMCTFCFR